MDNKKERYTEEMYDAQGNRMIQLNIFMNCIYDILKALKITDEDIKRYGGSPDRPPHLLAIDSIKEKDAEIESLQKKLNNITKVNA